MSLALHKRTAEARSQSLYFFFLAHILKYICQYTALRKCVVEKIVSKFGDFLDFSISCHHMSSYTSLFSSSMVEPLVYTQEQMPLGGKTTRPLLIQGRQYSFWKYSLYDFIYTSIWGALNTRCFFLVCAAIALICCMLSNTYT